VQHHRPLSLLLEPFFLSTSPPTPPPPLTPLLPPVDRYCEVRLLQAFDGLFIAGKSWQAGKQAFWQSAVIDWRRRSANVLSQILEAARFSPFLIDETPLTIHPLIPSIRSFQFTIPPLPWAPNPENSQQPPIPKTFCLIYLIC
jgi:hypothetical protein